MGSNKKADAMRYEQLVQYFTTTTDWKTGERRDRLLVNSKEIVALTRQAKLVTTGINAILRQCGERFNVLTEEDRKTLNAAVLVMKNLSEDIERAKDAVKRIEAKRDAEDKRREQEALAAVKTVFAQPGMEESIAILLYMGLDMIGGVSDLRRALAKKDTWSVQYYAQEIGKETARSLLFRVKKEIERGRSAMEAATELHQAFEAAKPALLERHGEFIRAVNAFLVQIQIENSNA